jgi:streptogramin lyase
MTGAPIAGKVMSGKQPLAGAHVYLFAAGNSGHGNASISLLESAAVGTSDSTGTYVLSGADGSFTVPGYYTCSSAQQLYLYVSGGNSGSGENGAAGELAVLGTCPALGTTVPSVIVNEVTTVAAGYAMAGFATDAVHVSSSDTPLALKGLSNAFANAAKLVSTTSGSALTKIPAGTATAPQSLVNSLANIISACIQSSGAGSIPCATLFSSVQPGSAAPSDTATALIDIAHSPATNAASLFALQTAASPFAPSLSVAPNDYSLGVVYTGGGMIGVASIAIDADGDAWLVSEGGDSDNFVGSVAEISNTGDFLSGPNGYPVSLEASGPLAIDTSGNAWIANHADDLSLDTSLIELSSSGAVLSGPIGFTGGGMDTVRSITFDANGNLWMTNSVPNSLTEMSPAGQFLSGPNGFTGGGLDFPVAMAIEPTGNVWVGNDQTFAINEFSPAGQPLTGNTGLTAAGLYGGNAAAVDSQGNIWFTRQGGDAQVSKLSNTGAILSGPVGYTGGGISKYRGAYYLAIDGDGNVWLPLNNGPGVVELSNAGTVLSGASGYENGISLFSLCVAADGSGDLWVSSENKAPAPLFYTDQVTEWIGIAAPVVTPLAAGVKSNTLGTRP